MLSNRKLNVLVVKVIRDIIKILNRLPLANHSCELARYKAIRRCRAALLRFRSSMSSIACMMSRVRIFHTANRSARLRSARLEDVICVKTN